MVASITKFFAEPCRTCWATPTHPRQRVFRRCPSSGDDRLPISSSSRAGLTRHDSRPRQAVTDANSTFVTPRHLIVVDVVQMMTEIEGARSSLLPLNAIISCLRAVPTAPACRRANELWRLYFRTLKQRPEPKTDCIKPSARDIHWRTI